jgi:hypothetical protein
MKFCVIIINDGRNDYLAETLKSFKENIIFPEGSTINKILIDDWPLERDEATIKALCKKYKIDKLVLNPENLGVNATVKKVWSLIPSDVDYVWHQENDFTFLEKINISDLMTVLESPVIVQCAIVRQPWFNDEKESGSLMNTRPERWRSGNSSGIDIVMHKDHFTFNPSLYKRKWVQDITPFGEYDLRNHLINTNGALWFSYLGTKEDKHRCFHIGERKR